MIWFCLRQVCVISLHDVATLVYMYPHVNVLKQVLRGHTRGDGLLSDYCDGSAYGTHPLFSQTFPSLEIMLYYDDVEVCNPLGSRAKTHKLG